MPPRVKQPRPLDEVLQRTLHRLRGVEATAAFAIPLVVERRRAELDEQVASLDRAFAVIEESDDGKADLLPSAVKTLLDARRQINRYREDDIVEILENSLFIGAFAIFDAFMGDLLKALFAVKPELLGSLTTQVPVSEVLVAASIDAFRETVIALQMEALRRQSYTDQFARLETLLGVKLKAFGAWPKFVEAGQRRNLIAHCDGLVSEQYLSCCRSGGVPISRDLKVGDRLDAHRSYIVSSVRLLMEIAVKLVHTIWRKVLPDQLKDSDHCLNSTMYDALHLEE
jgi:hypothetical protein